MGMVICPKHGDQIIGFVSIRLREAVLNDLTPDSYEVHLIKVRDIIMPDLDFSYYGWTQDHTYLVARNKLSNIMDIDELNQLSVPICPKCCQAFMQKYNLSKKTTDEILFVFTE